MPNADRVATPTPYTWTVPCPYTDSLKRPCDGIILSPQRTMIWTEESFSESGPVITRPCNRCHRVALVAPPGRPLISGHDLVNQSS